MKKVLWIAPRYPSREQILGFRKLINRGKFFEFDFVKGHVTVDDIEKNLHKYCCVAGTADIDVIEYIVNEGVLFYKTAAIKPASRLYKFLGFYRIDKFELERVTKLKNGIVLNISRHKLTEAEMNIMQKAGMRKLVAFRKYVTDGDVVLDLMQKYKAGDVFWVTNIAFYDKLCRHGVRPIRAVFNPEIGDYDRLYYVDVGGVMIDANGY